MTVEIGKRWRPGHRVYRDDGTGSYSEVNSPLLTETESRIQMALLRKPPPRHAFLPDDAFLPIPWLRNPEPRTTK